MQEKQEMNIKKLSSVKIIAITLLIISVIVFGSFSWFTMSKEVEGSGTQMTASDLPFELKTTGTIAPNHDILEAMGFKDGLSVIGGYSTAGKGDIKWMLEANDTMAGTGLRPGTDGNLNFTIVPLQNDNTKNLSVSYSLNLKAYKLTDSMKEQIALISTKIANGEKDENNEPYTLPTITLENLELLSDNPSDANYTKALDYIKGHILFFKNSDNTGRFQVGEPQTITFNCSEEKEIPLHWVWADTLGNMVLTSENVTNICTGDEKTVLITHIQNNPALYFVTADLDTEMLNNGKLKTNVLGDDLSDYYPTLNLAYNNADQIIGTNVQYIMIELVIDGEIIDAE